MKSMEKIRQKSFKLLDEEYLFVLFVLRFYLLVVLLVECIELDVIVLEYGAVISVQNVPFFSEFTGGKKVNRVKVLAIDTAF